MEVLKTRWAEGHLTTSEHFSSAILNAEAIGAVKCALELLDTEQLISELTSYDE